MKSIWIEDIKKPSFKELKHDIKTDVLIIGGGITGLLCAYMMKEQGIDCIVVEADEICSGITKNTTAKITCQHGLIYDKIIRRYGTDYARLYLEAQKQALDCYRDLSKKFICDFEEKNSFVYSVNDPEKIQMEAKALEKIGCKPLLLNDIPLPVSVAGAVGMEKQAQFNPIKLLYSLAKNLTIYENTKVQEIVADGVITKNAKIKAEKIVVATHFPFLNKHGFYFLKMYQHRSYVIAMESNNNLDGMYVDEDKKGMSFRTYKNLLLIGGGGHRTGKNGGGWKEISKFAENNYPSYRELYHFATQDCMTLDDIPYIGQYSKNTPSLYVATGFNKWGMTSAMVSAMILKDLVEDKKNKYSDIFSPSRSIMHTQLMLNAFEAVTSIIKPTVPRCPHMGCALTYNKQEHSWDCPCHGSRFDEEGNLIDNPSSGDMKNKLL